MSLNTDKVLRDYTHQNPPWRLKLDELRSEPTVKCIRKVLVHPQVDRDAVGVVSMLITLRLTPLNELETLI